MATEAHLRFLLGGHAGHHVAGAAPALKLPSVQVLPLHALVYTRTKTAAPALLLGSHAGHHVAGAAPALELPRGDLLRRVAHEVDGVHEDEHLGKGVRQVLCYGLPHLQQGMSAACSAQQALVPEQWLTGIWAKIVKAQARTVPDCCWLCFALWQVRGHQHQVQCIPGGPARTPRRPCAAARCAPADRA